MHKTDLKINRKWFQYLYFSGKHLGVSQHIELQIRMYQYLIFLLDSDTVILSGCGTCLFCHLQEFRRVNIGSLAESKKYGWGYQFHYVYHSSCHTREQNVGFDYF